MLRIPVHRDQHPDRVPPPQRCQDPRCVLRRHDLKGASDGDLKTPTRSARGRVMLP